MGDEDRIPHSVYGFYQALFGLPVQARNGSTTVYRIGDGPQFLSIRPVAAGESPRLARLGIAVRNFRISGTTSALESAGVCAAGSSMPSDPAMRWWIANRPTAGGAPVRELLVGDPNGLVLQVADRAYCGGSGALGNICSSVEPSAVKGAFHFTDPDGLIVQLQDTTYCGGGGPLGNIC